MNDQPPPLPPAMSLGARLMNVIAAPGEVFDSIKGRPHAVGNWLVPAFLVLVVSIIGGLIVFSQDFASHQVGEMVDQQMAQAGVTGPQAEAGKAVALMATKVSMVVGPAVGAFVLPFWTGLILWLVGAKILKGDFGFMKAVEAGGLSNMIGVLDALVKIPLVLVVGNVFATLSAGLLVKDFNPQQPAHAALAMLNVMLFWQLIVQAVALAKLSGRSFGVALAWLFGVSFGLAAFFMGIGFGLQAVFKR
jgi:hypothetical protein